METDEAIYLRYVQTDDEADLEALLIRHREGLLLFLLGFVRSEEDAEELLMDTFAKLAADKPPFDPRRPGSFKSWLYTIARRNALMRIRKRRIETVSLDENVLSETELPDMTLLKTERDRKLYQAMRSIKAEYRTALYLLFMEDMPHADIARVMRISIRQVYNLLERGKKSLKKELERMGMTDAQY